MPIPDFQSIMLPLLKLTGDGKEHSIHEFLDRLADEFSLSTQELNELLPSGKQTAFYNRVGWARTYLSKSGLLEMSRRSYYRITARGVMVLKSNPSRVDMKYLEQYPEYIEFREKEGHRRKPQENKSEFPIEIESKTPEEILEDAYQEIRDNLASAESRDIVGSQKNRFTRIIKCVTHSFDDLLG